MKGSADPLVRHLLALRIGAPVSAIEPVHHLQDDLGLDPLDLVLVALDLEDAESIEFPVAELESVRTVDDLARLVGKWRGARAGHAPLAAPVSSIRRRLRDATRDWKGDHAPRRRRASGHDA